MGQSRRRRLGQPRRRWLDQWRRLGQPLGWGSLGQRRRGLDKSLVTAQNRASFVTPDADTRLAILSANLAEKIRPRQFVAIFQSREEFLRWLRDPVPGVEWLQVEDMLNDPEVWSVAAQGQSKIPLDVVLSDPAAEFASLYRLVDVRIVRDVRVTIPVVPGVMKALRLAVSLQLPVRLLPGQPSNDALTVLGQALEFYLHDSSVETPVEFFHSLLAAMRGADTGSLWSILEQDPAIFAHTGSDGSASVAPDWAVNRLRTLVAQGAECAECPWQRLCGGYFKQPDPAYSCAGVKTIFATLQAAAEEIGRDLATEEQAAT
jgi:hypothetical protein